MPENKSVEAQCPPRVGDGDAHAQVSAPPALPLTSPLTGLRELTPRGAAPVVAGRTAFWGIASAYGICGEGPGPVRGRPEFAPREPCGVRTSVDNEAYTSLRAWARSVSRDVGGRVLSWETFLAPPFPLRAPIARRWPRDEARPPTLPTNLSGLSMFSLVIPTSESAGASGATAAPTGVGGRLGRNTSAAESGRLGSAGRETSMLTAGRTPHRRERGVVGGLGAVATTRGASAASNTAIRHSSSTCSPFLILLQRPSTMFTVAQFPECRWPKTEPSTC
mmetsp:Transcript_31951/g.71717  ORF Transcript_31951/g.71717 Transcript_31951/m.71717 type:complete len:278 (-) Transcript_31951:154-987(-)